MVTFTIYLHDCIRDVCIPLLPRRQENVRFLHTVAQLNDVFLKQYGVDYPAPAVTWVCAQARAYVDVPCTCTRQSSHQYVRQALDCVVMGLTF